MIIRLRDYPRAELVVPAREHQQLEHSREDNLEVYEQVDGMLEMIVDPHVELIDHLLRVVGDVEREY